MYYKLIEKKRNEWFASGDCPVRELVRYMQERGKMRDAQIEAIRTYLFLLIRCGNKPLWQLFSSGVFNTLDLQETELRQHTREYMLAHPAAQALYEYSVLKDRNGKQIAPELEKQMRLSPESIDCEEVFRKIFYNVSYTDYLFSLPMGAGKTFLMAAFIYINLYYASLKPADPTFAHNFIVLAPSGLKSSIIPSLKHIAEFDPAWVIPEPAAGQLRKMICFEVLDESKSGQKSNMTRNPNARKISSHQPFEDLMGLIAVTNAEKVILSKIDNDKDPMAFDAGELAEFNQANELRAIIGRIPGLSVIIDEVHHATDSEIKLRQVVTEWGKSNNFHSILGFSGTPYLDKAENVELAGGLSMRNTDLANVVYHYPLVDGVGNFLKRPTINYTDNAQEEIIRSGVSEFLENYGDTVYSDGTCAKLAIYCGRIENLEEIVYPLVSQILSARGMNPGESILKYHGGNREYAAPEGAETEFTLLDSPSSKIRIILLVQIGKEGWDCRSLTGVILPQKGVCPTIMVLQTSCRCLREVTHGNDETAVIWLNKFNADILNKQLKQQQNISLEEFRKAAAANMRTIRRFSRMETLNVPPVEFYQLKISYSSVPVEENFDIHVNLAPDKIIVMRDENLIHSQDIRGRKLGTYMADTASAELTTFNDWVFRIHKESFGLLPIDELYGQRGRLKAIYDRITAKSEKNGCQVLLPQFDQEEIRSRIRRAFTPSRKLRINEEIIPEKASLLRIERLTSPVQATETELYFPDTQTVTEIIEDDSKPEAPEMSEEEKAAMELLRKRGLCFIDTNDRHPERRQTYHYLPYRFDSRLERSVFSEEMIPLLKDKKIEVYFNGDDTLTGFSIGCHAKRGGKTWEYLGKYIPDFIMFNRDSNGKIDRIAIIETKGEGFGAKFTERRKFMDDVFIPQNNRMFGYDRFRFLYIEDTLPAAARERALSRTISEFFENQK